MFEAAAGLAPICTALLLSLASVNFFGNIPGVSIPSLYYYFTCSVSLAL